MDDKFVIMRINDTINIIKVDGKKKEDAIHAFNYIILRNGLMFKHPEMEVKVKPVNTIKDLDIKKLIEEEKIFKENHIDRVIVNCILKEKGLI